MRVLALTPNTDMPMPLVEALKEDGAEVAVTPWRKESFRPFLEGADLIVAMSPKYSVHWPVLASYAPTIGCGANLAQLYGKDLAYWAWSAGVSIDRGRKRVTKSVWGLFDGKNWVDFRDQRLRRGKRVQKAGDALLRPFTRFFAANGYIGPFEAVYTKVRRTYFLVAPRWDMGYGILGRILMDSELSASVFVSDLAQGKPVLLPQKKRFWFAHARSLFNHA